MKNEDLDKLLAGLEKSISEFRRKLRSSKQSNSDITIIQQIASLFEKITEAILGEDTELQERRRIYLNMVDFFKEKRSKRGGDQMYLSAAYGLCNETDARLTEGSDSSQAVQEILNWAKETIIAIKVYYEKRSNDEVIFRTEIFSRGIDGRDSPTRSKWEKKGDWDDLPPKVREEFIRTDKGILDYMWYPEQSGI